MSNDEVVRSNETLNDLSPDAVLNEEIAQEYQRQRRLLWDSLILLHNNVAVLRRVVAYPQKFLGPVRSVLFLVRRNLLENSLVIAHRLWNEADPSSASLRTVARLAREAEEPQHQAEMDARLKRAKPSPEVKAALKRTERYRHVRLGHLDNRVDLEHPDAHFPLTLIELESVAKFITGYYNATGIGVEAFFDLIEHGGDAPDRSQVERLLDGASIQSAWVTQYTEDPEWWWREYRPKLTDEEFQFLVKLRARMGLPPLEQRS